MLKRLGDFNEVIEYYQTMLSMVIDIKKLEGIEENQSIRGLCYNRAVLNNLGITIAQDFEYIEKKKPPTIDQDIMDELSKMDIRLQNQFKRIMQENNLSPFETLKQIRNAFLHGNYDVDFGELEGYSFFEFNDDKKSPEFSLNKKIIVNIESDKMSGTIDFKVAAYTLEPFYRRVRSHVSSMQNKRDADTPLSDAELRRRKKYISDYSDYIELKRWRHLSTMDEKYQQEVCFDILGIPYENIDSFGIGNRFCIFMQEYVTRRLQNINIPLNGPLSKELFITSCETPLIYADMMLAMTNYACGYVKENKNNVNGYNLFEYHNLNGMSGVKPTIGLSSTIKKGIDTTGVIESLDSQIVSTESNINNIRQKICSISGAINDRNPNRAMFEALKKEQEDKLLQAQKRKNILVQRKKEYIGTTYDDYSEFFRRMRNSIAHGNYSIDYTQAFRRKDLSRTKFTFRDYDDDDKTKPCFEVVLSGRQLNAIVNGVKERVNTKLKDENSFDTVRATGIKEIVSKEELMNCKKSTIYSYVD